MTTEEVRLTLRRLAASVPPGTPVTISADWLMQLTETVEPDTLLTADVAAARLGWTTNHLYRQSKTLPFRVAISRRNVRYSEAGLTRWLLEHNGK